MGRIDLNEDMKKLIAENLPAATAGAMSDFIVEAEKTRDDLVHAETAIKNQTNTIKSKEAIIEKLEEQVCEINAFKKRDKAVAEREEALQVRERDIKLEVANIQLDAANDRNDKIEQLVEKVFGHPSVTVSTYRTKPIMSRLNDGSIPYECGQMHENEGTTTTKNKI